MKKLYTFVIILALFTFALELLSLHLADRLASDGVTVRKTQENINKIEEKNHVLNTKVLELTSFERIYLRAGLLGFVKAKSYIALKDQTKLSFNR